MRSIYYKKSLNGQYKNITHICACPENYSGIFEVCAKLSHDRCIMKLMIETCFNKISTLNNVYFILFRIYFILIHSQTN